MANRQRVIRLTRIRRTFVFKGEQFFAYHDGGTAMVGVPEHGLREFCQLVARG